MELAAVFNVALHVPRLSQPEQKSVLQQLGAFAGPDVSEAFLPGPHSVMDVLWRCSVRGCPPMQADLCS
jgi:hypothetical protein